MTRHPMRALLVGTLALAACFNPKLGDAPFRCGPGDDCPPGYHCDEEKICVLHDVDGGTHPGDGPTTADARRDAPPRPDAPPQLADAPPCTGTEFDTCLDENTALLCDGSEVTCAFRCDSGARLCEQCDPSKPTFCSAADAVGTCTSDGQIGPGQSACMDFCLESGGGAGCVTLEPANLPSTLCDTPASKARHVTARLTVDTDVCADGTIVSQPTAGLAAPSICVLVYTDITIDAAGGLTATGHNALALVATHDFVLNGIVDASAAGPTSGAGAPNPPPGLGKTLTSSYTAGGGGGGYTQNGGGGGTDTDDGAVSGGSTYGGPELVPLAGGSPGGSGGAPPSICDVNCPQIGKGGGGGGALQLVACHAMSLGIVGHVSAEGGGGQGGFFLLPPGSGAATTAGGGGGGGGGGAILVEAGSLDVNEFAFVSATGAGGGGGGTFLESIGERGGDGEDGQIDHGAYGGPGGSQFAGAGGDGSTGPNTTAPTPGPGLSAQMMGYGAGGGGGSVGRIRINTPAGSPFDASGLIVVPSPSTGAVKHHP